MQDRFRETGLTMLKSILVFLLPAISIAFAVQGAWAEPQSFVTTEYGRPQHLVAVDRTRRINLICMGHGTPVVMFLSGLGSGAVDWRKVQPAIGQMTEACAYDRAGYGFSDAPNRPSDATNAVADLHALLQAAHLPSPVVLVGHSLGGLYATLYAETYPKQIAGMLLVEPSFHGQSQAIAKAVGEAAAHQIAASQVRTLAAVDQCVALAKTGRLALASDANSDCLDNPPDPDPAVHAERNRVARSAAHELALRDEFLNANVTGADGKTTDDRETVRAGASLGSIPLVVLTRGDLNKLPGVTTEQSTHAEQAWRTGHDQLATLSRHGTNIVVPHTGHFIQLEQPAVVIESITQILAKVRS